MNDGTFGTMVLAVGSVPEGNTMIHVAIYESTHEDKLVRKVQVSRTFVKGGETVHRSLGRMSSAATLALAPLLVNAGTALAEMERPATPAPAAKRSRKRKSAEGASASA